MSPLLQCLDGQVLSPPPIWLMRQAGRYLPEYRALRAQAGGFLDLVYNPELAAEVTLLPVRRFDFDAAILFSDILVIPHALGRKLTFAAGEGPRLEPLTDEADLAALDISKIEKNLGPIFETVARVRETLPKDKALIGFCGAPWTVASYVIAGQGGDLQEAAKLCAYTRENFFGKLIDKLVESSIIYLCAQLQAGADCVQIFDSWAGALDSFGFEKWVIAPTKKIIDGVRKIFPKAKIIGFPRGCGAMLEAYVKQTGVTAVGLDWQQDLEACARELTIPFQGNLDPLRLFSDASELEKIVLQMKQATKGKPYIFNLGHGILPSTPIETVANLVRAVRSA
jgi:uroporphyrinogen decarboxylase